MFVRHVIEPFSFMGFGVCGSISLSLSFFLVVALFLLRSMIPVGVCESFFPRRSFEKRMTI